MDRLKNKIALVTGAGEGLGAQIARRFHEEGAQVIINDVNHTAARATADALSGTAIVADVADSAAVKRMFDQVAADFPRLDILVNNAGFATVSGDEDIVRRYNEVPLRQMAEREAGGPVVTHLDLTVEMTDEAWHRMIAVHLDGTFFCTREALKIMNPQLSGCIINMGSIMGTSGGMASAYSAAKAGILGFTRAVAREVASRGIRVNALAPGYIDTALTSTLQEARALLEAQTPMARFGDCDDVAWPAVYLASDEAKFVTGQVLSPNGGLVMSQ